jgi:hypothetical protein
VTATRKKLIKISIAAALIVMVVTVGLFTWIHPNPKVVGDLTASDVHEITRIARSHRTAGFTTPHPFASAPLLKRLLYRLRGAVARMEIIERPTVKPGMAYVVYRDRFDTNHSYVYYFKTDSADGWRWSSEKETFK